MTAELLFVVAGISGFSLVMGFGALIGDLFLDD